MDIYMEEQNLMFVSGMVLFAVLEALETGDLARLKLVISQFCFEDPQELIDNKLQGIARPFKELKARNIIRFPDEVREQSLINESTDKLDGECPCEVSFYGNEIFIRWTMPRIEFVWQCNSATKLAHIGMVIVEELFHIRQMITPNTRAITVLGTMLEFDAVKHIGQMDEDDKQLIAQVMESDVTFFFDTYFKPYVDRIQWFLDRADADDYHKTMTPQEFIQAIMYLTNKYGYAQEVGETLLADITSFIHMNPSMGIPMLLAEGLGEFIKRLVDCYKKYSQQ